MQHGGTGVNHLEFRPLICTCSTIGASQTSRLLSLVLTLICVGQVHHPAPRQRPVDDVDAQDVTGAGMGVDEGQISGERLLCFCNDGLKGCPLAPPLLMKMRDADHGLSPHTHTHV